MLKKKMNDSAYSMTPPNSPCQHDMDLEITDTETTITGETGHKVTQSSLVEKSPYFCCGGKPYPGRGLRLYEHFSFHENGVLKCGALVRLTSVVQFQDREFKPSLKLFGFPFFYLALEEQDERDQLFMFARQTIRDVRNASDQDSTRKVSNRIELIKFFLYVKDFTERFLPEEESSCRKFVQELTKKLHLLLLHVGKLSDQPSDSKYCLVQHSSIHHTFHQHLDFCWYLLEILHTLTTSTRTAGALADVRLCQKVGGAEDGDSLSPFDQLIQFLLFDLVSLAVPIFEKIRSQEWLNVSPFLCGCVLEMWTLVLRLTTARKEKHGTESFWVQLHQTLQTLWDACTNKGAEETQDSDVFMLSITPQPSCPANFCLWLVTHLAHLTCFDDSGLLHDANYSLNNFFIIHMLLEKVLWSSPKEETLRACLCCCVSISCLWTPNTNVITVLWEHFSQRLNDRFQLQAASVEGLAVFSKNPSALLEKCEKLSCNDLDGLSQETSFCLFLRLLVRLLKGSGAEWRQIKGRFYSKFHQRRVQALTETGLHNLTCLFLVLAMCVEPGEVLLLKVPPKLQRIKQCAMERPFWTRQALKLSALYDMLDPTTSSFTLRTRIWCGALAMMEQLARGKHDFSILAEKMASSFNSLCRQMVDGKLDYGQHQDAWTLVAMYLDSVRSIMDRSDLTGPENVLIGEGIRCVLEAAHENELRHTLTTLDSMATRLRCVTDDATGGQVSPQVSRHHRQQEVADSLWQFVFPFVREHACTQTPPLSLADLAVTLTHLSLTFPPPTCLCPEGTVSLVKQFVASDAVAVSFACHYLAQILGESTLLTVILATSQASGVSNPVSAACSLQQKPNVASNSAQTACGLQQKDVIKVWVRCLMLMPETSSSLQELTQQIFLLPEVISLSISGDCGANNMLSASHPASWKTFLKSIEQFFNNAKSLLEKSQARDLVLPYFQDVPQHAASLLRTMPPASTMIHMFHVVGHLVKYCAPALYLQSKPCPLPAIIKTFLLPLPVYHTDRPLQPSHLTAVRETLHLFIEGLGKLDYSRLPDVQRHLRDIITNYLFRFPLTLTDLDRHPVLRVISKPQKQALTQDCIKFRKFLTSVVSSLLKSSCDPVHTKVLEAVSRRSQQADPAVVI